VNASCADLEAALEGQDPALAEAFARHAEACATCAGELRLWREIAAAAPSLRKEWPSPALEARIRKALWAEARKREGLAPAVWFSLAAAASLVVFLLSRAFLPSPPSAAVTSAPGVRVPGIDESKERLLSERALLEVEKAEEAYVRSIEGLAKVAAPRLTKDASPVLASYREKLLVLDAAIAECRSQVERNRFNAHLRLELLSVYHEKQRTLEALLKEDPDAL
jgi:hypothetical protein